jgi:hypothetical protein
MEDFVSRLRFSATLCVSTFAFKSVFKKLALIRVIRVKALSLCISAFKIRFKKSASISAD